MKQITRQLIQQLLSENDIFFQSTHANLCIPIIDRIYRKMCLGILFSPIKVDGNLICDGHHRYIASLLAKNRIETVPATRTAATEVVPWHTVAFMDEDWDTPAKIILLNEQDAKFNDISVTQIIELLK
jgi:hypothetical protein